jgi:hypothetical protein
MSAGTRERQQAPLDASEFRPEIGKEFAAAINNRTSSTDLVLKQTE